MGTETANNEKSVECPRPGHADLTGGMKYNHRDLRNVLEEQVPVKLQQEWLSAHS